MGFRVYTAGLPDTNKKKIFFWGIEFVSKKKFFFDAELPNLPLHFTQSVVLYKSHRGWERVLFLRIMCDTDKQSLWSWLWDNVLYRKVDGLWPPSLQLIHYLLSPPRYTEEHFNPELISYMYPVYCTDETKYRITTAHGSYDFVPSEAQIFARTRPEVIPDYKNLPAPLQYVLQMIDTHRCYVNILDLVQQIT